MFFGSDDLTLSRADVRAAQAVCLRCPVRVDCLFTALNRREGFGIWGGMTSKNRGRLLSDNGNDPHRALSSYLAGRLPSR
jgi:hypothetical protein